MTDARWPGWPFPSTDPRVVPQPAEQQEQQEPKTCRADGRCQYAIDHGAEGLGHCPAGKCCMPDHVEQQEPQQFPATLIVLTPSGPQHACTRHASEIAAVLVCMGASAAMVPAPDGAQCANCINEAKS